AEKLSYLEKKVLLSLEELGEATPEEIMEKGNFEKLVEVMNGVSWAQMKKLVDVDEKTSKVYYLSNKEKVRKLPERKVLEAIFNEDKGVSVSYLESRGIIEKDEISAAVGWMKKKGWAQLSKSEDGSTLISITDEGRSMVDRKGIDEQLLEDLTMREGIPEEDCNPKAVEMLRNRKGLLLERPVVSRMVRITDAGKEVLRIGIDLKEEIAQLTPEMIQSGKWKNAKVREYDIEAFAPAIYGGKLHPITILINQMREVFLAMGFTEIRGDYVESAFWNMDVLFTAQDHPARDLHDTFYLRKPEKTSLDKDAELVEIIKQVHEDGWKTGSKGWGYKWDIGEAQKLLLRTHTTVNTIRYLAERPEPPLKVFCIGRVFRNEEINYSHLPEFTQVEGIVCEENANFDMLCALLKEFYHKMGIGNIRIRPGYFPYTEPSLEVDILHGGEWMELGGAGIFRPEVTEPHGIRYPVLAWGLGLERLAMLKWNLSDIRDLYISDIDWLKKASIL
ncbi:MAG: phenylalanine--tRNA ligase subunit alpha, partial [Thermoplasmata archaeon]|nr:phenylalanine--tRNA ligase subunit alpha [Thermoplasmata archaeon]